MSDECACKCSCGKSKEQLAKDALTRKLVQERYANLAKASDPTAEQLKKLAVAFGYEESDLKDAAGAANMGLSCGNPVAMAGIREGESVLDLGCGSGFDVFQCSKRVGATGKVYGVDFTQEMLDRAIRMQKERNITNVEFIRADIETLPLPDNSVDVVISNCVINLVPDKFKVLCEIWRVLKAGGRVAISDMVAIKEIPEQFKESPEYIAGCIAGAIPEEEYKLMLRAAGFENVQIINTNLDMNEYNQKKKRGEVPEGVKQPEDFNAIVYSGKIYGLKGK